MREPDQVVTFVVPVLSGIGRPQLSVYYSFVLSDIAKEARSISMDDYMSTTLMIPMTTAQCRSASTPCSCHRRIPAWCLQTRQKRLGPSDIKRHERLIDDSWLGGTDRVRLNPDSGRVDEGIAMVRRRVHSPREAESQYCYRQW